MPEKGRPAWLIGLVIAVAVGVIAGGVAIVADVLGDVEESARIEAIAATGDPRSWVVTYIAGPGGGCREPQGVEVVDESSTSVTLEARTITRDVTPDGRACPAVGVSARATIRLKEPLGTRTVIDASRQGEDEDAVVPVR